MTSSLRGDLGPVRGNEHHSPSLFLGFLCVCVCVCVCVLSVFWGFFFFQSSSFIFFF